MFHVIHTIRWFDYMLLNEWYKLLLGKGVPSLVSTDFMYVVLGLTSVLFCTVSGL